MRFRVNYGQGQVSHPMRTKGAALAYLASLTFGGCFVQRYEDGEWFNLRGDGTWMISLH